MQAFLPTMTIHSCYSENKNIINNKDIIPLDQTYSITFLIWVSSFFFFLGATKTNSYPNSQNPEFYFHFFSFSNNQTNKIPRSFFPISYTLLFLPLSWRVSCLTPPHTIAPSLPFPMGTASVQCFAGPENVSFKGLELSVVSTKLGFHKSFSVGGPTRTHSPSSITTTTKKRKKLCYVYYSVCGFFTSPWRVRESKGWGSWLVEARGFVWPCFEFHTACSEVTGTHITRHFL